MSHFLTVLRVRICLHETNVIGIESYKICQEDKFLINAFMLLWYVFLAFYALSCSKLQLSHNYSAKLTLPQVSGDGKWNLSMIGVIIFVGYIPNSGKSRLSYRNLAEKWTSRCDLMEK